MRDVESNWLAVVISIWHGASLYDGHAMSFLETSDDASCMMRDINHNCSGCIGCCACWALTWMSQDSLTRMNLQWYVPCHDLGPHAVATIIVCFWSCLYEASVSIKMHALIVKSLSRSENLVRLVGMIANNRSSR